MIECLVLLFSRRVRGQFEQARSRAFRLRRGSTRLGSVSIFRRNDFALKLGEDARDGEDVSGTPCESVSDKILLTPETILPILPILTGFISFPF
jgi:hypothetical protein